MAANVELRDQVLDPIARALRLNQVERQHLHNLVRSTVAASSSQGLVLEPLDDGMRIMLESLEPPAMIIDSRGDVHAMNRMGGALLVGLEPLPSRRANHTAEHDGDTRCRGEKRFLHPTVGELLRHVEALGLPDGERWLYAYVPRPGPHSAEAMRPLGSWTATQDVEAAVGRRA